MRTINGLEAYTHAEMLDKHIGPVGSPERKQYEAEVAAELSQSENKPRVPEAALNEHGPVDPA